MPSPIMLSTKPRAFIQLWLPADQQTQAGRAVSDNAGGRRLTWCVIVAVSCALRFVQVPLVEPIGPGVCGHFNDGASSPYPVRRHGYRSRLETAGHPATDFVREIGITTVTVTVVSLRLRKLETKVSALDCRYLSSAAEFIGQPYETSKRI
jgi:hypothetical protein